jgi:hypothetical protein
MKPIQNYVFRVQIMNREGDLYEDFYLQQPSNREYLAAAQIRDYIEKHYPTYEKTEGVVLIYPKDNR